MEAKTSYHILSMSVIYLLLMGTIWANLIPYSSWIVDTKIELNELCNAEEGELEKEENKKDQDFRDDFRFTKTDLLKSNTLITQLKILYSTNYQEIHSPPPDSSLV